MVKRVLVPVVVSLWSVGLWCAAVLADTGVPSGAVANPPQPTIDWFARGASALAILISMASFVWGRVDKHNDRKAEKAAKDPVIDLDVTGFAGGPLNYELRIENRADVSLALLSMSCTGGVRLTSDEGHVGSKGTAIDYNGQRIDPRKSETYVGEIYPPAGGGDVDFVVRTRVNEHQPRVHEARIKRNLRG